MDLLEKIYLGNTVQSWMIGFCIAAVVFFVLKIIQRMAISKLSKLARSTDNQIDDLIVSMLGRTKFLTLMVAAAYVASYSIILKPSVGALWQKAVTIILMIQGGLWAGAGVQFWLRLTLRKRKELDASSTTTLSLLGYVAQVILWIIVLLLILDNLGVNITGLVAGLGIGGIAVALAVQNILGDLLASLSIVLDKPFIVGDFIVIDSVSGTVEYIGLKTTRLRSPSGEQLIISNNDLLKSRIRNFRRMQERRVVFNLGVIYQTPLEKLTLINTIIRESIESQKTARFDRVHFKEYGNSSMNFEIVYDVLDSDYTLYMDTQQAINLEIFRRFGEEGIEFAYPTQTIFVQRT